MTLETIAIIQKRRGQKPDRPKPRRRKNKGKGKSSNGNRSNINAGAPSTNRTQASSSTVHGSNMPTISCTSDQSTSSHTSEGSSQEMVIDDEVKTLHSMVKRPSLNRSFSENYNNYSKKTDYTESVSIQSDHEEHTKVIYTLADDQKSKQNSSSLDSISSQKSCDSGFVNEKRFDRQDQDSLDSDAIDTEEDTTSRNVSPNKNINIDLQKGGEIFLRGEINVLERSSSSLLPYDKNTDISVKGCETNTSTLRKSSSMASENVGTLCFYCNERPKDACFVHQKISHQVCCYKCAKKQYRINPICPVCRRKVEKITRNILA